jgi:hypothetical protein
VLTEGHGVLIGVAMRQSPPRQRWLNRFRRVLIRREKKPDHFLAFHHFTCDVIALRAIGLFG